MGRAKRNPSNPFWLLPFGFALALLCGWVSHSWADMMTKSGVAWFWPSRVRCVLPGNADYRMEVGRGGEMGFLLVVALLGIVLMPLAETGKGAAGLIRGALGDLGKVRHAPGATLPEVEHVPSRGVQSSELLRRWLP